MKFKFWPVLGLTIGLVACSDTPQEEVIVSSADIKMSTKAALPLKAEDDRLVISALKKVSEPNACILPITITNGTDEAATISMMQFTVTGTGENDSGNMFAQTVEPGDTNTAHLLFPTRQCTELLEITAPNVKCQMGEVDCSADVEFEATKGLSFERAETSAED